MQGSVERLDPWLVCFALVFRVEQFASRRALVVVPHTRNVAETTSERV